MNPTFYYEYGKKVIIEILTNLIGDVYSELDGTEVY
jgi:hypothetical protein